MRYGLLVITVAFLATACSRETPLAGTSTDDGAPILAHVVTKAHKVDIISTADGVRYTIKTLEGTVLVEAATQQTLERDKPELWDSVKGAIVSTQGAEIDASATTN